LFVAVENGIGGLERRRLRPNRRYAGENDNSQFEQTHVS
jgi:hypothetical protein